MWTEEQTTALRGYVERCMSYAEISRRISADFGITISRNACIGRAQRIGLASGRPPDPELKAKRVERDKAKWKAQAVRRKAERWAAKPWLATREERRKERGEESKRIRSTCKSKTSPEYRNHLPRIGEMSKSELRAMLAAAVANTAQMEQA